MTESQPKRGTKALELWCKRIVEGYPNVKIDNMTTSWRDGLAFCALIHHFRPDLIEFEKLDKKDILTNNDLAFRTAEKHFGIPALLEASDMLNYEVPDRLSILTYLSQYHRVFRNQEIPSSDTDRLNKFTSSLMKSSSTSSSSSTTKTVPPSFRASPPPQSALFGQSSLKREPCVKCNMPVFLAERIFYKNSLYHNSCFACATCATQLIPSDMSKIVELSEHNLKCQSCVDKEQGMLLFDDYYDGKETDTDTIPAYDNGVDHRNRDEEEDADKVKDILNNTDDNIHNLLRQSLSDEEKRKSVKGYYSKEKNGGGVQSHLSPQQQLNGIHSYEPRSTKSDDDENHDDDDVGGGGGGVNLRSDDSKRTLATANTSKLSEQQSLSLKFATQMLLNHNNNNNNNTSNDNIDSSNTNNDDKNNDANANDDDDDDVNNVDDSVSCSNNENDVNYISSAKSNEDKIIDRNLSNDRDIETEQNCDQLTCINNNNNNSNDNDNINDNEMITKNSSYDVDGEIMDKIVKCNDENINVMINIIVNNEPQLQPQLATSNDIKKDRDGDDDDDDVIVKNIANSDDDDGDDRNIDRKDHGDAIDIPKLSNEPIIVPSIISDHKIVVVPAAIDDKKPERDRTNIEKKDEKIIHLLEDDHRYPRDLNPFGDDEDEEVEDGYARNESSDYKTVVKPTPKPRISTNPFEDEEDDVEQNNQITPISRTPVPAPRRSLAVQNRSPFGSNASLNSISRPRKGKAPLPPPMAAAAATTLSPPRHQTLFSTNPFGESDDAQSIPSTSSQQTTPKTLRKKRPAPTPPTSTTATPVKSAIDTSKTEEQPQLTTTAEAIETSTTNSSYQDAIPVRESTPELNTTRRLISLDISLITANEDEKNGDVSENRVIVGSEITQSDYKRKLIVDKLDMTDDDDSIVMTTSLSERQLEKMKDNKEAKNRNRKSAELSMATAAAGTGAPHQNDITSAKIWKHTKGPAPPLPVCRYTVKHELSNQEINHELEVIKVQQNGLEKQGVMLEKMIRSRSEGSGDIDQCDNDNNDSADKSISSTDTDVDDLIMQLFEIVNEKNELFRRQAELLNLRRQYRLEQEQADLEYKIRVSMAQPERNKTDSDKEKEDALIARLVQVVQQRNEVVECFEMDRLREIEEDLSIKQSLEMHTAKRDTKLIQSTGNTLTKLSKKEKKKLKEAFKLSGHSKKSKIDADKDEDETEINNVPPKHKKHKFIKFPLIK